MLTAPEQPDVEMLRVPVIKVFDGDGFLTRIYHPGRGTAVEVAIRLGFVDAPEMDQPGGPEAQAFLQSIIGGKSVDLAILTKMDTGGIVDRHGRIVAVPYLPVAHQDPPAT
ncbi:MAG: thermonuclease family protein, partial [Pseudomonadota bacterium]